MIRGLTGRTHPDVKFCKQSVPTPGLRMHYHQCQRKVVLDGYCTQHHPDTVAKRRIKTQEAWDKRFAAGPYGRIKVLVQTLDRVRRHARKIKDEKLLALLDKGIKK